MTPEQRAAILKQAENQAKELENLSPAEQEQLRAQLRTVANTTDMRNIAPAKLDPSKVKSVNDERKDLASYQKKTIRR